MNLIPNIFKSASSLMIFLYREVLSYLNKPEILSAFKRDPSAPKKELFLSFYAFYIPIHIFQGFFFLDLKVTSHSDMVAIRSIHQNLVCNKLYLENLLQNRVEKSIFEKNRCRSVSEQAYALKSQKFSPSSEFQFNSEL